MLTSIMSQSTWCHGTIYRALESAFESECTTTTNFPKKQICPNCHNPTKARDKYILFMKNNLLKLNVMVPIGDILRATLK